MLDEFDQALLAEVQRDNLRTHAALGEKVGLSASSVRRRLASLRERGVIRADVSLVDADATMVTVVVLVRFETESVEGVQAFKERMRAAPEVAQCYSVAGAVDFVLVVHVPDQATYEAWGERMLLADPLIQRYDSHIVWSCVKYTTELPIT